MYICICANLNYQLIFVYDYLSSILDILLIDHFLSRIYFTYLWKSL